MVWITHADLYGQIFPKYHVHALWKTLELVICGACEMNETARHADILLSATIPLEEWNINLPSWHYWSPISKPVHRPMHEAKSDIDIVCRLMAHLQELDTVGSFFQDNLAL